MKHTPDDADALREENKRLREALETVASAFDKWPTNAVRPSTDAVELAAFARAVLASNQAVKP